MSVEFYRGSPGLFGMVRSIFNIRKSLRNILYYTILYYTILYYTILYHII